MNHRLIINLRSKLIEVATYQGRNALTKCPVQTRNGEDSEESKECPSRQGESRESPETPSELVVSRLFIKQVLHDNGRDKSLKTVRVHRGRWRA